METQYNQDDCGNGTGTGCGMVYTFVPQDERYRMYLFIEDPGCNFILATCPNCGNVTRIFVYADTVLRNIAYGIKWSITARCDDELRHRRTEIFAEQENPVAAPNSQERYEEWLIENATDDEIRHELGL